MGKAHYKSMKDDNEILSKHGYKLLIKHFKAYNVPPHSETQHPNHSANSKHVLNVLSP